jgi:hypothetical protein
MQAPTIEASSATPSLLPQPAQPAQPAQPQQPGIPTPQPVTISMPQAGGSPRVVYQAVRAKREVLGEYMSRLLNRRDNVAERLNNPNVTPAERRALEQHLEQLNDRIVDMEKQLHAADAEVVAAAGVPGAVVPEPDGRVGGEPPEEMLVVGTVFAGIALVILALAYARRLWKGAATVVAHIPAAFEARLTRFEQSLDAVAIEIERVSEGQRFLTKVLADPGSRALGPGPAQPIETRAKPAEPVPRVGSRTPV